MVSTTNNNHSVAFCQENAQPDALLPRLIILTGHYGSGKTSLAVQLAGCISRFGARVTLCDLDIVNPYFRTSDRRAELEKRGIRVVSSRFAGGNLDIPALPRELGAALSARDGYTIVDVGGDDRGALALGRYAPQITNGQPYEMLFVVNFFRPRTRTPQDALTVLREVETTCGIRATALINNSNLGGETTAADMKSTYGRMEELSALAHLPVAYTAADRRLQFALSDVVQPLWLDFGEEMEKLPWQK